MSAINRRNNFKEKKKKKPSYQLHIYTILSSFDFSEDFSQLSEKAYIVLYHLRRHVVSKGSNFQTFMTA